MDNFIRKVRDYLSKLSLVKKISLLGVVSLVIVIAIILLVMRKDTQYTILFSNLDLKEEGVIVENLKQMGIKYKFTEGTIYVPADKKSHILLFLARKDLLPSKGETFNDIFEKEGFFGVTKTRERIDFIRGKQGELERAIMEIEGIKAVKVQIVLPEEKAFSEDETPATASVILTLKPFAKLGSKEIKAIMRMVSFSVPGLKLENVVVLDNRGRDLSEKVNLNPDNAESLIDKRILFRTKYEKDLRDKALKMLTKVLGPGKAEVQVTAELNFDRIERKLKNISTPVEGEEKGVPVSEQTKTEVYEGDTPIPAGVPGTKTNIPTYKKKVSKKNSSYKKMEQITNYDYNQMLENHVIVPGDVRRLNISVVIDKSDLSDEKKTEFINIVKTAVGFNQARGDTISLMASKFDRSIYEKQREEAEKQRQAERQRIIILTIIVLALLIGIPVFFKIVKMIKEKKLEEARREEEQRRMAARRKILEPLLSPEEQEKKDKQDRIKQHVMEKPEESAQIIRIWLNED